MDKNTIRLLVKEKIGSMSPDSKVQESDEVCQNLIQKLNQKDFQTLITYEPFGDEVDITTVTNWCRDEWKSVIVLPQTRTDISIPSEGLIIIPWRAFTIEGRRIGRGGGFYDKLLKNNPALQSIGACFACQIFPDIPQDSWDQRVDEVVFVENILE